MNKRYIIAVFVIGLLTMSCQKRSRLKQDTFELKVSPQASSIQPNDQIKIAAFGATPSDARVDINVEWFVNPTDQGALSDAVGPSTVFTASPSGFGTVKVIAMYRSFTAESEIGIGVAGIMNDTKAAGFVGVFKSGGSTLFELSDETTFFQEGSRSTKALFNIPALGWGGWYVEEGAAGGAETRDMSNFAGGRLRFSVKTPINLKVGIGKEENNSVVELIDLGSYLDDQWHEISIAMSALLSLSQSHVPLDFSMISVFFTVTAGSDINNNQAISGSFYIDNVRWTQN